MSSQLTITLVKGLSHCTQMQRKIAFGLGLKKREQTVVRSNDSTTRGMVKKIMHLLKVEESRNGSGQGIGNRYEIK
jgi:large subunit ribosomal protein L30